MSSNLDNNREIKIFYSNDQYFMWNAEDIKFIRKKFKIIGNLIGTSICNSAYQNKSHGLPSQLMDEELLFLLIEYTGTKLYKQDFNLINFNECALEFKESENQFLDYCNKVHIDKTTDQLKKKFDKIMNGKAKKLKLNIEQLNRDEIFNEEIKRIRPIGEKTKPKQIFKESLWSSSFRLIEHNEQINNIIIDQLDQSTNQTIPIDKQLNATNIKLSKKLNKHMLLRYFVFIDLNRKGLYLSKGNKFGSDFLAYPFDPLFCHASYMVICLEDHNQLSRTLLQTYTRLGSQVNKHILLVKFNDELSDDLLNNELNKLINLNDLLNLLKKEFKLDYMAIRWKSMK